MNRRRVSLALLALLAGCAREEGLVQPVSLDDGDSFYQHLFELPSPIPLPFDAGRSLAVEVRLALPKGAVLELERDREGAPWLRLPAGARIDRVERWRDQDGGWRIADVRGAHIDPNGARRFHVLRPEHAGASQLFGYAFPAGDEHALERAHDAMADDMRDGRGFAWPMPDARRERAIQRYRGLSSCNACHALHKPTPPRADARLLPGVPDVHRPTDGAGFYALRALFSDEGFLEDHRPVQPALENPYVDVRCPEGEVLDARRARCSDGSVAAARLDLAAGVRSKDAHSLQICAARRALWPRLSAEAQAALQASLDACGE